MTNKINKAGKDLILGYWYYDIKIKIAVLLI